METLDLTSFLGLIVGATQIIKKECEKYGLPLGDWARVVSFVLGGLGVYVMTYHAPLWDSLVPLFLMFGGTGGVSLVKELIKNAKVQ